MTLVLILRRGNTEPQRVPQRGFSRLGAVLLTVLVLSWNIGGAVVAVIVALRG